MLGPSSRGATGILRVTASSAFGRKMIAPMLPAFLDQNPDLRVDLDLSDVVVDIVAAGIDVAIRIAPLRENGLVARRLAESSRVLCAAPSYLARHPLPRTREDLAAHDCLLPSGSTYWSFEHAGHTVRQSVSGRLTSSSLEALHEACVHGLGIAQMSRWYVQEDVAAGRLTVLSVTEATPSP